MSRNLLNEKSPVAAKTFNMNMNMNMMIKKCWKHLNLKEEDMIGFSV
jgi:uncharacterized protein YehS (DUF1456 family)